MAQPSQIPDDLVEIPLESLTPRRTPPTRPTTPSVPVTLPQSSRPSGEIPDDLVPITLEAVVPNVRYESPTDTPQRPRPLNLTTLPQQLLPPPDRAMVLEILGAMAGATPIGAGVRGAVALPRLYRAFRNANQIVQGTARSMGTSAIGGMTGRAVGETLARPEGTPPPDPSALLQRTLRAGVESAAGEALVPGIGAAGTLVKKVPGIRALFPTYGMSKLAAKTATPDTRFVAEQLGRMGLTPTPAEAGVSRINRLLQNVMEGSPLSAGAWQDFYARRGEGFTKEIDRIIGEFGGRVDPSEAGEVIKAAKVGHAARLGEADVADATTRAALANRGVDDALGAMEAATGGPALGREPLGKLGQSLIERAHKAAQDLSNAQYEAIWKAAEGLTADPTPLVTRAQELLEGVGTVGAKTGVLGRSGRAVKALTDAGAEAAEKVDQVVDQIPGGRALLDLVQKADAGRPMAPKMQSFLSEIEDIVGEAGLETLTARQLHQLRSVYGRATRELSGMDRGVFAQLFKETDTLLKEAMGGETSPLWQSYQGASRSFKAMKETFEEGALARAAEVEPAAFLDTVLGQKGAVETLERTREVLGPEGWSAVQARALRDLTTSPGGTRLTPEKMLRKIDNMDEDQLKVLFAGQTDSLAALREALPIAAGASTGVREAQKRAAQGVGKAQALNPYGLVARTLSKAGRPEIRKLRTMVGPEGWKKVQANWLEETFKGRGPEEITDNLFPKLPPREQLQEIFPTDRANFLYQFARMQSTLKREAKQRGGGMKMWIQLATPGAIGAVTGLVTGSPITGAASGLAILLTPHMLTRIAQSPEMGRALIQGMKTSATHTPGAPARATTQVGVRAATRLYEFLQSEGLIDAQGRPMDPPGDRPEAPPDPSQGSSPSPAGAPPPSPPPGF